MNFLFFRASRVCRATGRRDSKCAGVNAKSPGDALLIVNMVMFRRVATAAPRVRPIAVWHCESFRRYIV